MVYPRLRYNRQANNYQGIQRQREIKEQLVKTRYTDDIISESLSFKSVIAGKSTGLAETRRAGNC